MKDELIEILDSATKIAVLCADATTAAGQLARGHLSGPTASHYLAEALAGVALLGAETAQEAETVTFRLDCPGPLEGFLVECTAAGTLRGYTKKKILNDFDGLGAPKDVQVLGGSGTFEIIRSIPGAILSSGTVATRGRRARWPPGSTPTSTSRSSAASARRSPRPSATTACPSSRAASSRSVRRTAMPPRSRRSRPCSPRAPPRGRSPRAPPRRARS